MAISSEYTYWHLTPHGWVDGNSKTDSGNWSKSVPYDTFVTVKYQEVLEDDFSITKSTERTEVRADTARIQELESKFPFEFHI